MTISTETATMTARVILQAIRENRGEPEHIVALAVIESLQAVAGNRSFRGSLQLIHRELKAFALARERRGDEEA